MFNKFGIIVALFSLSSYAFSIPITDHTSLKNALSAEGINYTGSVLIDHIDHFEMNIFGGKVDNSPFNEIRSVFLDLKLKYWTGYFLLTITEGLPDINMFNPKKPDEISFILNIQHTAGKDKPHKGDDAAGQIFNTNGKIYGALGPTSWSHSETKIHDSVHHPDKFDASAEAFGGRAISSWVFKSKVKHVNEPGILGLVIVALSCLVLFYAPSPAVRERNI